MITVSELPGGFRVVTDAMPHLETASVGIWIGAGARHETADQHGLSHFLEHMAFKGTRRRSARGLVEEIESAGGDLNAATGVEQTAYTARVLAGDTGLALDILSDILTDSLFETAELEREKGVILQEISAVEDTPDDLVFDVFSALAFPGQPIGRPILGTPATVKGFDRDAIEGFLDTNYSGGAAVVAAAGAVDHAQIVAETQQRFGRLAVPATPRAPAAARYVGGEKREKRSIEQTHLVVGFESFSFHDPRDYAAHVFASAVGGGMSSRLFQEVREERGLAYAIYSFNWAYSDTGVFGFYAGTAPADAAEVLRVATDCLADAALTLSLEEVERAKAQMKVGLLVALESSGARADQLARQVLAFGRVLTRADIIARIDAIDVETVRTTGATLLRSVPTCVTLGPSGKTLGAARIADRLKGL